MMAIDVFKCIPWTNSYLSISFHFIDALFHLPFTFVAVEAEKETQCSTVGRRKPALLVGSGACAVKGTNHPFVPSVPSSPRAFSGSFSRMYFCYHLDKVPEKKTI